MQDKLYKESKHFFNLELLHEREGSCVIFGEKRGHEYDSNALSPGVCAISEWYCPLRRLWDQQMAIGQINSNPHKTSDQLSGPTSRSYFWEFYASSGPDSEAFFDLRNFGAIPSSGLKGRFGEEEIPLSHLQVAREVPDDTLSALPK
ncbi:9161_t:CDS:2, partial [Acaulospora colombiana]